VPDTVVGFSSEVLATPSILVENGFEALDFSGQDKIKFVAGNCKFDNAVFGT
jgi:hypothetical protein